MNKDINYDNYTVKELMEAKESIDRHSFPERYCKIIELLKEKNSKVTCNGDSREAERKEKISVIFTFFLWLFVAVYSVFVYFKTKELLETGEFTIGSARYSFLKNLSPESSFAVTMLNLLILILSAIYLTKKIVSKN
ncbi:hypothetical protein [Alteromonas lipotrueiana]|uniref:hypothetical protein n=1 Tax=Alteromonas lipotrueiana TaxID=2803815 RepID=UPI001C43D536|nr:hypothetical protein [Alteromonas lipotrueiana]